MLQKDFYVGQRVKLYDQDDDCWVYGHVKGVYERSVLIQWADLDDACEHFEDEFESIKVGNPSLD